MPEASVPASEAAGGSIPLVTDIPPELIEGTPQPIKVLNLVQAPTTAPTTAPVGAPLIPPGPAPADVRGRVLSVEDNPVNQLLIEQLLQRLPGVELVQADSGQAALELARRERPDLVLLDLHLPDMEGVQWLDALRADARLAAIPVVALSASSLEEDVRQAREHGACDYWTKPLDFEQFLGGLSRLLSRRGS